GPVVKRILRVRRQTDICRGEDAGDELIRRPPGELHVVGQAQLVTQDHQLAEAVSRADQREGNVVAAELVHHDAGGPDHDIDTVLRSHDADVGGEETATAAQLGAGLPTP